MSESLEGYWYRIQTQRMMRQSVALFACAADGNIPGYASLDDATVVHSKETSVTAAALSQALELPFERTVALASGGLLHDIGKSSCLDVVTSHKSLEEFDQEARERLRHHPLVGKQIIELVYDTPEWQEPMVYTWGHHSHKSNDAHNFPTRQDFYDALERGEMSHELYSLLMHYGPVIAYADALNVLLHPDRRGHLMEKIRKQYPDYGTNTTGVAIEIVSAELASISNTHGVTAHDMGNIVVAQLDTIAALAQQI